MFAHRGPAGRGRRVWPQSAAPCWHQPPRPPRPGDSDSGRRPSHPAAGVRVAVKDGMAGWQIILIALSAACAATATVLLDRARAVRRAVP